MSEDSFVVRKRLSQLPLWKEKGSQRKPWSFELEITERCNNNCRHCYINLAAGNRHAKDRELSLSEIEKIAGEAVDLGSLWCLISGAEPLLRDDFIDIYLLLRGKGLLVSVFTNACLVTQEHVDLFKTHPPRGIEVTVYGVTEETYERITRKPGSFAAFQKGLGLLLDNGIPVQLKTMAMRSNLHELPLIADFCRRHTVDFFRFDPLLHLRYDGDEDRNREIRSERLNAEEIVLIEHGDSERSGSLQKHCDAFIFKDHAHDTCRHIFRCGIGKTSFTVSSEGFFYLCSSLRHPDFTRDLKNENLRDVWEQFVPEVLDTRSDDSIFLDKCHSCPIVNLCIWCPAHAYLETGRLDGWSEYFCQVAHTRQEALEDKVKGIESSE